MDVVSYVCLDFYFVISLALFGQFHQVFFIDLALLFETPHRSVHVDCKSDDDV
jgi:hypothetical protein